MLSGGDIAVFWGKIVILIPCLGRRWCPEFTTVAALRLSPPQAHGVLIIAGRIAPCGAPCATRNRPPLWMGRPVSARRFQGSGAGSMMIELIFLRPVVLPP